SSANVLPLVSSSACSVVALGLRKVNTCSRLGRPRAVVSGSAATNDARTCPANDAAESAWANFFSSFHGDLFTPPRSTVGIQGPPSLKSPSSHPSVVVVDQCQESSFATSHTCAYVVPPSGGVGTWLLTFKSDRLKPELRAFPRTNSPVVPPLGGLRT